MVKIWVHLHQYAALTSLTEWAFGERKRQARSRSLKSPSTVSRSISSLLLPASFRCCHARHTRLINWTSCDSVDVSVAPVRLLQFIWCKVYNITYQSLRHKVMTKNLQIDLRHIRTRRELQQLLKWSSNCKRRKFLDRKGWKWLAYVWYMIWMKSQTNAME